jgi:hypothetical protein
MQEEYILKHAHYTSKNNLEKKYEGPLLPSIVYNDSIIRRNIVSLATNKQFTNKLQAQELRETIQALLNLITKEPTNYILGLHRYWGFVFEYEGRPVLICENECKYDDNVVIYVLEDFMYPPIESREKMILTGAFFLCLVGLSKFLDAS